MLSACESSARSAELPGAKGRGPGRLIAGLALVLSFAACGSDDGSPAIKGGGKGTAYGLRAAGLVRCAGPVRGRGGASVSLYASGGFAAVLAIGPAATDDAI